MKDFKKILLLVNFLSIINSSNSFAEFKFSQNFKTVSDFNHQNEFLEKSNRTIKSTKNSFENKKNEQIEVLNDSSKDFDNTYNSDEYFLNNNQENKPNPLNAQDDINSSTTEAINSGKKVIQNQKIVKILKGKKSLTIGNYFGIDYLNANLRFREMNDTKEVIQYNSPDLKNGFGLKYFYAVNFNNFFIAPEIFYEKIEVKNKNSYNRFKVIENNVVQTDKRNEFGYKFMKIHQRYGGKINFGYDFDSNFSPYLFGGLSYIDFSNLASPYTISQRNTALRDYGYDVFQIKKGRKLVPFYGYGIKIKLTNRFYLNAEYNILDFMVNSKAHNYAPLNNSEIKNSNFINLDNSLRIFKAGLLYNF